MADKDTDRKLTGKNNIRSDKYYGANFKSAHFYNTLDKKDIEIEHPNGSDEGAGDNTKYINFLKLEYDRTKYNKYVIATVFGLLPKSLKEIPITIQITTQDGIKIYEETKGAKVDNVYSKAKFNILDILDKIQKDDKLSKIGVPYWVYAVITMKNKDGDTETMGAWNGLEILNWCSKKFTKDINDSKKYLRDKFGELYILDNPNIYNLVELELDKKNNAVSTFGRWVEIEGLTKKIKHNFTNKHNKNPKFLDYIAYIISNRAEKQRENIRERAKEDVQDQFNFSGDGLPYIADPAVFTMEEAIDIGDQIYLSITGKQKTSKGNVAYWGGMRSVYKEALRNKGVPVKDFEWKETNPDIIGKKPNHDNLLKPIAFNASYSNAIKTQSWQFGRVSATLKGNITACHNGIFYIDATLTYNDDYFSWKLDGKDFEQNTKIWVASQNYNFKGKNNWFFNKTNQLGIYFFAGNFRKNNKSIGDFRIFPATWGKGTPAKWSEASPKFDDPDPKISGQMLIKYARAFKFHTLGKIPADKVIELENELKNERIARRKK